MVNPPRPKVNQMQISKKYKKIVGALMLLVIVATTLATPTQAVFADEEPASQSSSLVTPWTVLKAGLAGAGLVAFGVLATPFIPVAGLGAGLGGLVTTVASGVGLGTGLTAAGVGFAGLGGAMAVGAVQDVLDPNSWNFTVNSVLGAIVAFVRELASLTLTFMGPIMDMGISLNFKTNLDKVDIINVGWKLVRDLANMIFIFILLYVAIGTILQLASVNAKQTIPKIILAALLVNFSMLITGMFIDASNILTLEFYNALTNDNEYSVSAVFRNSSQLGQLMDPDFWSMERLRTTSEIIGRDILLIVIILTLAYFFFMVGIMFIGRLATFAFLLVLSPLAVVGYFIPQLKKYSAEWSTMLINQCLVAPMMMFVLYMVAYLATSASKFHTDTSGDTMGASYYLNFIIILVFLKLGLRESAKMANELTTSVQEFGKKAVGFVGGVLAGGAALAGVSIIGGKGGDMLEKYIDGKSDWDEDKKKRMRKNWLKPIRQGSWDIRSAPPIFGGAVGGALGYAMGGASAGQAINAGGYAAGREENVRYYTELIADIKKNSTLSATQKRQQMYLAMKKAGAGVGSEVYGKMSSKDKESTFKGAYAARENKQLYELFKDKLPQDARNEHDLIDALYDTNKTSEDIGNILKKMGPDVAKLHEGALIPDATVPNRGEMLKAHTTVTMGYIHDAFAVKNVAKRKELYDFKIKSGEDDEKVYLKGTAKKFWNPEDRSSGDDDDDEKKGRGRGKSTEEEDPLQQKIPELATPGGAGGGSGSAGAGPSSPV